MQRASLIRTPRPRPLQPCDERLQLPCLVHRRQCDEPFDSIRLLSAYFVTVVIRPSSVLIGLPHHTAKPDRWRIVFVVVFQPVFKLQECVCVRIRMQILAM